MVLDYVEPKLGSCGQLFEEYQHGESPRLWDCSQGRQLNPTFRTAPRSKPYGDCVPGPTVHDGLFPQKPFS
jgi:hypothetical protein